MSFSFDIYSKSELKSIKNKQKDKPCRLQTDKYSSASEYQLSREMVTSELIDSSILLELLRGWPGIYIATTIGGQIKSLNHEAEKLFGYSKLDALGRDIHTLFANRLQPIFLSSALPYCAKHGWVSLSPDGPIEGRKQNGELFPAKVQISERVVDGLAVHIYAITDETERVRQKLQIEQLEREVSYLAKHSLLGELAAAITHELSQPLTAITNYTAAAGRFWKRPSDENIENGLALVGKAGAQAKRAWQMMHRLRKLLQHRGCEFADDDMRLAMQEAIELATLGASDHGVSIEVNMPDEPVPVRMDRVQVQILLANLIRNAVDELRSFKGERKIWINLDTDEDGNAVFCVEDSGSGISPDVFENIFDPFLTTKAEGLGVGLAVSRRIALAHNGRLSADNRRGGGAAFSFTIPLSGGENTCRQQSR